MFLKFTKENVVPECNHLELHISHGHGGVNYFNYNNEEAGYRLHFSPCFLDPKEKGMFHAVMYPCLMDAKYSYKVLIYNKYRKSKKTLEELNKILDNNKDKILELYQEGNNNKIYSFLKQIYSKYM